MKSTFNLLRTTIAYSNIFFLVFGAFAADVWATGGDTGCGTTEGDLGPGSGLVPEIVPGMAPLVFLAVFGLIALLRYYYRKKHS